MISRLMLLVAVAVIVLAQAAGAVTLWNQSDFDVWGMGFFNSVSGSPPFGSTNYCVNHVTVECGWYVESISTYYSAVDPGWGSAITEGYLHVFTKTGPLPIDGSDDPTTSSLVAMTAVLNGDHFILTASGLNLDLPAGEYWIGITPIAPGGVMGPEIHLSSMTYVGDASASYDAYGMPMPMWMNFNPGLDATILIDGTVTGPSATDGTTWGRLKALYQE